MSLNLPADIWKPLAKLNEHHEKLLKDRQVTFQGLRTLQEDRQKAVERDRNAYAKAIREGKDDPGTPNQQAADNAIAATQRKLDAITTALEQVHEEMRETVEANKAKWLTETEAQRHKVREEYQEAVAALLQARHRVADVDARYRWLHNYDQKGLFQVIYPPLQNIPTMNNQPLAWELVSQALQKDLALPRTESGPLQLVEN